MILVTDGKGDRQTFETPEEALSFIMDQASETAETAEVDVNEDLYNVCESHKFHCDCDACAKLNLESNTLMDRKRNYKQDAREHNKVKAQNLERVQVFAKELVDLTDKYTRNVIRAERFADIARFAFEDMIKDLHIVSLKQSEMKV